MSNILVTLIIVFAILKLYISFIKLLDLKRKNTLISSVTHIILFYEIVIITSHFFFPSLSYQLPTILHFIGTNVKILHISLFSILYLTLNLVFIISSYNLNDNLIYLYNILLSTHFILTSLFTLKLI